MAEITLHGGQTCIVDDDDLELVTNGRRWYLGNRGYVVGSAWPDPGTIMLHRLVMEVTREDTSAIVVFRNGNRLDCRKSNLMLTDRHNHPSNPKGRPRKPNPDIEEDSDTRTAAWVLNKDTGKKEFRELPRYGGR